eukprot:COSAG01_NODE_6200_length_3797_cov_318.655760_2_plen_240_part_00
MPAGGKKETDRQWRTTRRERRASGPPPTNQGPCGSPRPVMTPLELTCPAVEEQTDRTGRLPPLFATVHARGGFRRPPPLASSKLVGSGGVQQRGELRQLHDGRGAATQGAQQGHEGRSLLPLLLPRGIAWLTARERPRATQRMRLPSGGRSRRPRAPPRGEGGAGRRSPSPPPPRHHPRGSSTERAPAPPAPDSPTWVATRGRRPPVSVPLKAAFFNANEQLFADHVVSPRRRGRVAHL